MRKGNRIIYMGNISDVIRSLWADYSSSTRQLLEHIAETDGEDAALQIAIAIQQGIGQGFVQKWAI